jgi:hypothetical protein
MGVRKWGHKRTVVSEDGFAKQAPRPLGLNRRWQLPAATLS